MNYFVAVLIALDQFVNALCGGWPDETLSSRAWRWKLDDVRTWPVTVIDGFFFWETNSRVSLDEEGKLTQKFCGHCEDSYLSERNDRHLPPELRNKGIELCK